MSTADTMKPIQTIQKTIFAISTSAVGMSATRSISLAPVRGGQAIEVQPRQHAPDDPADDERHDESAGEDDDGGDEPRHEQHERGREVVPRLGERSAMS